MIRSCWFFLLDVEIRFNKEKFVLRMMEVFYVGYVLMKDGLKLDLLKIEVI